MVPNGISDVDLIASTDEAEITVGAQRRRQLDNLAEIDRRGLWKNSGAKDMAGWVSARFGVSPYRARRMVKAGYALESLPLTAKALETGLLDLDRVLELVRLATPETEADLIKWARRVTPQWIGHKADGAERQRTRENRTKDGARYLDWWWGPDATLRFEGLLPNDAGLKFVRSIEHLADEMPISPDPKDETTLPQRRADALLAMATDSNGSGETDAATVVVYAPLDVLLGKNLGGELEEGPVIHADVIRRLVCDGKIELVCHDSDGKVCRIGVETYKVPRHLRRQVMRRDGHRCTFPGCHSKRYIDTHHIVPWPSGATELDNLTCLCRHHHKLVHEHGWRVRLTKDGRTEWFKPDGRRFDPGPVPRAGPPGTISRTFATCLEPPGILEDSLDWRRSHAYREAA